MLHTVLARTGALLRETADCWMTDNAPRMSASLAFYSVLSLIPFLIVVASAASSVFGQESAQGRLMWQIQDLVGSEGARAIEGLMQTSHSTKTVTLLGLLTLALGASGVVMDLRETLNIIWHVPTNAAFNGFRGLLRVIKERFYLFCLIAAAGFLLVALLAINTIVEALAAQFGPFLPISPLLLRLAVFLGSFIVITILFAAIYKLVPDIKLRWNDVIVGASVTSLLFTLGKQLIGFYLGKAAYGSIYGAAGSFVILLVWIYYSAQLFFFGAEFTRVYARRVHPRKELQ